MTISDTSGPLETTLVPVPPSDVLALLGCARALQTNGVSLTASDRAFNVVAIGTPEGFGRAELMRDADGLFWSYTRQGDSGDEYWLIRTSRAYRCNRRP